MSSRAGVRSSGAAGPPTLEARTLQVGEEIYRLKDRPVPDATVLGPTRERVLPLSGSTRSRQEAGLSAILMADAGSRRDGARRMLPGCDRQGQPPYA